MPAPQASRARAGRSVFAVVALLLLAAGLRFFRIGHQSYWNDEGNSRVLVGRDLPTLLRNTAADVHPPGYYLALQGWRALVGESELGLRSLSALQGVVLAAVVYRLGRDRIGPRAGAVAAGLAALNPFLVYYGQEARMYAQVALLGAASFWLWGRLWRARPPRREVALGYALVTTLGLYTHYAFGFVMVAQAVSALTRLAARRPRAWLTRLWPPALAGLLFLPWAPTAYRHLTTWPAERAARPLAEAVPELARYLAFGRTVETLEAAPGLLALGLGLALALGRHGLRPSVRDLWLWLLVPAGLTLALGTLTEAFSKFLVVAVPPLCVLLAAAVAPGPAALRPGDQPPAASGPRSPVAGPLGQYAALTLAAAFLLPLTFGSLHNLYTNPAYFRDDYRGIAARLLAIGRADDAVITLAPNQVEAFAYYYPEASRLFPLPDSRPLDRARTEAQLTQLAAAHPRLFVLYWGDQQADPERFIESWLNTHAFKAGEQWYGQVRLATYAAARPALAPSVTTQARFGEQITLTGYTLTPTTLAPGDLLQLTLFWRATAPVTARYKVFVHLYAAPEAPPVAQTDGEPGGGLVLTTLWTPGQTVADNHGLLLPPDLPPGAYRLMIGLYQLDDLTRLPVGVGDTIMGDRLDLAEVLVR